MGSKFYFGDRVLMKDVGVGRVINIMTHTSNITENTYHRYEVKFDTRDIVDWFDEDELELYVEKSCEPSNNIIQNSATRPCYYLEEKATFHRWVDETKMIVKFSEHLKMDAMWKLKNLYEDIGLLAGGMDAIPVITTFALIEVADGSMKKVPPEEIRFVTEGN